MIVPLVSLLALSSSVTQARSHGHRLSHRAANKGCRAPVPRTADLGLQVYTGALGGLSAPAVTYVGSQARPYNVGSRQELDLITALGVSCDQQHNLCADAANKAGNKSYTVGDCDVQNQDCHRSITTDVPAPVVSSTPSTTSAASAPSESVSSELATPVSSASVETEAPAPVETSEAPAPVETSEGPAPVESSEAPAAPVETEAPSTTAAEKPITTAEAPVETPASSVSAVTSATFVPQSSASPERLATSSAAAPATATPITSSKAAPSSTTATASASAPTSAALSSYTGLKRGDGTFYGNDGSGGNCLLPARSDLMFAAWPGATYNNAEFCGACVRVTGPKGSVDVEVTNKCPECAEGSLDLSTAAFEKIADKSAGRVPITWDFISCKASGLETKPVEFVFKSGSSAYYVGIQARHTDVGIKSLAVEVDGAFKELPRKDFNYFVADSGLGAGPFKIKLTLQDGSSSITDGVVLNAVIGDA